MSFTFERPVKAALDVKELEYVVSLLQSDHSDEEHFRDGSVDANDVKNYLLSRHNVKLSEDEVKLIFSDLAGGESDEDCIDIVELVAILVIPFLKRIVTANNDDEGNNLGFGISRFEREASEKQQQYQSLKAFNKSIISNVLKVIMNDATGSTEEKVLTKDLLRQIFTSYGEEELIHDEELLSDMIKAAVGEDQEGNCFLNEETFARGLTNDLNPYDLEKETKFTTHYEDVFGLVTDGAPELECDVSGRENDEIIVERSDSFHIERHRHHEEVKRVFTMPHIDFFADSFRDKTQYLLVWLAILFGYISYFSQFTSFDVCKEEHKREFGCQIASSIVVWLAQLTIMLVVVAPSVLILSLGNNIHRHSLAEVLCGIAGILILIIFPVFYDRINSWFISTKSVEGAEYMTTVFDVINLSIGAALLCIQVCNIIRWAVPDNKLTMNKVLTLILRGTGVRAEFGIKQAAMRKVNILVQNAYDLHTQTSEELQIILNYMKFSEKREMFGGFFWFWKQYLSGRLIEEEGIWIHTRLLAGNIAQFILTFGLLVFGSFFIDDIVNMVYRALDTMRSPGNDNCGCRFDIDSCIFPVENEQSLGIGICDDVIFPNKTCVDHFVPIPLGLQDLKDEMICGPISRHIFSVEAQLNEISLGLTPLGCYDQMMVPVQGIYSSSNESSLDTFCSAPILSCAFKGENDRGESLASCVIGFEFGMPFKFHGELCQNYTHIEDFRVLLEQKEDFDEAIDEMIPTKTEIRSALWTGVVAAFVAGISNAVVCIPSQISTILKFRSGVIGSLHDKYFEIRRLGMLNTSFLLGAMCWSAIAMINAVFNIGWFLSFFIYYHVTRPYIKTGLSILIGLLVTMIMKAIVARMLNVTNFAGFYRKYPLLANITSLCFECIHLALMSGFILLRTVKLVFVIILNLGRLDRPVLAQGVGEFGCLRLDNLPNMFFQDLLALDAHRHPYIERFGMILLMKLKFKQDFARKEGSIWRLLFVFALMPHLRKFRISTRGNDALTMTDASEAELLGLLNTFYRKYSRLSSMMSSKNPQDGEELGLTIRRSLRRRSSRKKCISYRPSKASIYDKEISGVSFLSINEEDDLSLAESSVIREEMTEDQDILSEEKM